VIPVKCEEYGRLAHLFLDGRLDEEEEKLLKEHMAVCERCTEKLALLRAMEERAKGIEPVEPPKEYWDTFSGRVMATIDAGKKEKAASGLKKTLAALFTVSSPRLRIAAGAVSIAVVVIVGVLFLKERGGEIVPPRRIVETERSPGYEGIRREERQDAVVDRSKRQMDRHAERPESDIEIARTGVEEEKGLPPEETVSGKKIAPEKEKTRERDEGVETESAEMVVMEESVAAPEREASQRIAGKTARRLDSAAPALGRKTDKSEAFRGEEMNKSALARIAGAPPGATDDHYVLNGTAVYRIEEVDTSIPENELGKLIEVWTAYIEENPHDSLILHGYEQVATAYYLIVIRTHDEAVISEGSRLIEGYAAQSDDPVLKEILLKMQQKIKALHKN
jgi:hypothetical protein